MLRADVFWRENDEFWERKNLKVETVCPFTKGSNKFNVSMRMILENIDPQEF